MALDIRVGDCILTLAYGGGLLTRAIQFYQRELLRHPAPWWRATHAEVVITIDPDHVITFSQTAPIAKTVLRGRLELGAMLKVDNPRYALLRFKDYANVVTEPFLRGMTGFTDKKLGEHKNWWNRFWDGLYDAGALPMYPLNSSVIK